MLHGVRDRDYGAQLQWQGSKVIFYRKNAIISHNTCKKLHLRSLTLFEGTREGVVALYEAEVHGDDPCRASKLYQSETAPVSFIQKDGPGHVIGKR